MAVDEASAAGVAAVAADAGPAGRGVLAPRGRHAPPRRVRRRSTGRQRRAWRRLLPPGPADLLLAALNL
jgi:hypothetical protein